MPAIRMNRPILMSVILAAAFFATRLPGAEPPVTVSETKTGFTLDNGLVTAQVAKHSGDLISLKYKNLELLEAGSGHPFGYWSHDASRGEHSTRLTIDPKANGGALGEISVKSVYFPPPGGSGGGGGGGFGRSTACDIEIRYALARGLSGIYAYSIFEHRTNYPTTGIGEARFAAKLNPDIFNYLNVDARRRKIMLTPADWLAGTELNSSEARRLNTGIYRGQVEHKYDYSANQFETRAYGWLGTTQQVGFWFINPSIEYLSGGPTKYELTGHLDISAEAAPVLLNYWRSSHYGGAVCPMTNGEAWSKVVGPFLIYCNTAKTPDAMWQDALARADRETKAWPYDWVAGVDYPRKAERSTVKGQLVLRDSQAPQLKLDHLLVGLSAPDYVPPIPPRMNRGPDGFGMFGPAGGGEDDTNSAGNFPGGFGRDTNGGFNFTNRSDGFGTNFDGGLTNGFGRSGTNRFRGGRFGRGGFGGFGGPRIVDWQNDAKHYEFWVRGDAQGHFTIPNVRSGNYTLHAIADGVLGEFTLTNVTIAAGQTLDLGKLSWQPVRHGRQLWDIGIPNRTGAEFFKGDDYYHWGWYLEYAKRFTNDVNYVVGRSDFHKDWFFEQVPHNEDPENTNGHGRGRETTWSIAFNLPAAPHGQATLRLAICGAGTRTLDASVNGQSIGSVTNLVYNATINRDGIGGSWSEHDLAFDASLMKAGENVMKLTVPGGSLTSGIIYDYLRLELDENARVRK